MNNNNDLELYAQGEYVGTKINEICSVFYIIRSTDNVKKYFNPEKYLNGKLLYVSDYFRTNGISIDKGSFKNGNGEILDYYDDESIFTIASYKDGFLNGKWIMYYPNGKIAESGNYILNEKNGTWLKYNKRGLKISVNEFN